MKISASGSGGFAGLAEHFELDTTRVDNGKAIEELLRNLDFFRSSAPAADHIGADIPRWDITVADAGRARTISFLDDGSAESQPWQALLAQLRSA